MARAKTAVMTIAAPGSSLTFFPLRQFSITEASNGKSRMSRHLAIASVTYTGSSQISIDCSHVRPHAEMASKALLVAHRRVIHSHSSE